MVAFLRSENVYIQIFFFVLHTFETSLVLLVTSLYDFFSEAETPINEDIVSFAINGDMMCHKPPMTFIR